MESRGSDSAEYVLLILRAPPRTLNPRAPPRTLTPRTPPRALTPRARAPSLMANGEHPRRFTMRTAPSKPAFLDVVCLRTPRAESSTEPSATHNKDFKKQNEGNPNADPDEHGEEHPAL